MSESSRQGRVLVVGACGRMGEQVRKWVDAHPELSLGAALEAAGHPRIGESLAPGVTLGCEVKDRLEAKLKEEHRQIIIDTHKNTPNTRSRTITITLRPEEHSQQH